MLQRCPQEAPRPQQPSTQRTWRTWLEALRRRWLHRHEDRPAGDGRGAGGRRGQYQRGLMYRGRGGPLLLQGGRPRRTRDCCCHHTLLLSLGCSGRWAGRTLRPALVARAAAFATLTTRRRSACYASVLLLLLLPA